jgi:hypothetical protein
MKAVPEYLTLGYPRSFELPRNNSIWKRDETKHDLKHRGLEFESEVFLCQTGCKPDNGLPVGKCLIFRSSFSSFCNVLTKRFGSCTCEKHASVTDVNWVRTGSYTKELAKGILAAVRAARWQHDSLREQLHEVPREFMHPTNRERRFSFGFAWQILSPDSVQIKRGTEFACEFFVDL